MWLIFVLTDGAQRAMRASNTGASCWTHVGRGTRTAMMMGFGVHRASSSAVLSPDVVRGMPRYRLHGRLPRRWFTKWINASHVFIGRDAIERVMCFCV